MDGHPNNLRTRFKKGHKHSPETLEKMRKAGLGRPAWNKGLKGWRKGEKHPWMPKGDAHWSNKEENKASIHRGENHWHWKEDRSSIARKSERDNPLYKRWRRIVWERDGFKCKIANKDCDGRIEAHHILRWADYPELRYDVNNGITLCRAHHPKKRKEEDNLVAQFQALVVQFNT